MTRCARLRLFAATAAVGASLGVATMASGQEPLPSHTVPNSPGSLAYPERGLSTPPAQYPVLSGPELRALWVEAGAAYGIPWQILGAINRVETNYGTNMGPSSAGAVGWMQFIPSTWDRWGVDADGDGIADPWDPQDAVYAAARYLAATGGQTDLRRAIFAYNHAEWYVNDVIELAQRLGSTGGQSLDIPVPTTTPTGPLVQVDDLPQRRIATTKEMREARARIAEIKDEAAGLRAARTAQARSAGDATISTSEFAATESSISELDEREKETRAELAKARGELQETMSQLAGLEQESGATTFWRPLSAPVISTAPGGRVAPVLLPAGAPMTLIGRPGHGTHNQADWQSRNAVDIAAAPGTPIVATEDGVITRVSGQDAADGTRVTASGKKIYGYSITLAGTADTYFYAHVSDVVVFSGQQVKAGQTIATISPWPGGAPHLHFGVRVGSPELVVGSGRVAASVATPRVSRPATVAQPVFEIVDDPDEAMTFVRGS